MTKEEIVTALAQVYSLPKAKRQLLADADSTKYYVMMTYPYCCFVRDKDGHDLFYTSDINEAVVYRRALEEKNIYCEYAVYALTKEDSQ